MKSPTHLKFIRGLDCIIPGCGDNVTVEAAHVRYGDLRAAKPEAGMGHKDDRWVLPLCGRHHREQHKGSERAFWTKMGLDPIPLAAWLWSATGDHEAGMKIIYAARTEHRSQDEAMEVVAEIQFGNDDGRWWVFVYSDGLLLKNFGPYATRSDAMIMGGEAADLIQKHHFRRVEQAS